MHQFAPKPADSSPETQALRQMTEQMLNLQTCTELVRLPKPSQSVKDTLIVFSNFYRVGGKAQHTWASV